MATPLARISLACLALLCLSPALLPGSALAAAPAGVTVRVEGVSETILAPTQLTTTTTPVVNGSEGSCSGTSAIGALQDATGGGWTGRWYGEESGYFVQSIEGQGELVGAAKYYWSFWVNDVYQETGACEVQLAAGDRVLFFPICYESCPAGGEPTPLEIEAPPSANVSEPVSVTVKQYNALGEASPAAGARISWSGGTALTESAGRATISFSATGTYELHVSGAETGPAAVRTESYVCVHDGSDGNCGTTIPVSAGSPGTGAGGVASLRESAAPYTGPFALVSRVAGIRESEVYPAGRGPRLLSGTISSHSAVTSVSLVLRREYRGRCYAYDGTRERFLRARCGHGTPFQVSSTNGYSYLLPSALAPGRYVLDVHATDLAGNTITLARGSSRLVFYVR
jgi:hypothetical protein